VNETADPDDPRVARRSIDIDIEYLMSHLHTRGHAMRLRPETARWMGGADTTNLRVSDAERNEVADRLSRHFSEGRLDQGEFKERLDAAMSAKTQGDLRGLFDDLPPLASERAEPDEEHRGRRRRSIPLLALLTIVALIAVASVPPVHWFHVPWLLISVLAIFFWVRVVPRHRHGSRHR
jgi:hypothetical protein